MTTEKIKARMQVCLYRIFDARKSSHADHSRVLSHGTLLRQFNYTFMQHYSACTQCFLLSHHGRQNSVLRLWTRTVGGPSSIVEPLLNPPFWGKFFVFAFLTGPVVLFSFWSAFSGTFERKLMRAAGFQRRDNLIHRRRERWIDGQQIFILIAT